MKKIPFLISFIFCLAAAFGGTIFFNPKTTAAADGTFKQISTASDLQTYLSSYTSESAELTTNIDMEGAQLSPIGTETSPFEKTFDGKGFKISNFTIDAQEANSLGLFGVAKGAVIKNLALENVAINVDDAVIISVGALVGKAENCTFENISISSTDVKFNYDFSLTGSQVNFGVLAGTLDSCSLTNIISRANALTNGWSLPETDNKKTYNFGGVAGRFLNSNFKFGVVEANFNAELAQDFDGTANFGGVAGEVSQGESTLVNLAMQNTFALTNNSTAASLHVGEICGEIKAPVPTPGNISFIHYKKNDNVDVFGEKANFAYENPSNQDFVTESMYELHYLAPDGNSYNYFNNQSWHPLYGIWDFNSVWYVAASNIQLQNFSSDFNVSVANVDTRVMELASLPTKFNYGDRVEIIFNFKTNDEGTSLKEFYELTQIRRNNANVAAIVPTSNGYKVSGSEAYDIEQTESGFKIIIKSLDRSTSGTYTVIAKEKYFNAKVTSRLYVDGELQSEIPAYVYHADNGSLGTPTSETLQWSMAYDMAYRIETRAKSNTTNSTDGTLFWYMVGHDEQGRETTTQIPADYISNGVLQFTFGHGIFTGDIEIFARYTDDSCKVTFTFNEGVARIVVSRSITVDKSGTVEPISKDETALWLEIYIYKEYTFDYQRFVDELAYKSEDPTRVFCTPQEQNESGDLKYYSFLVDMTLLQRSDFSDAFPIEVKTNSNFKTNRAWIWWLVGGICGAIVITLVVLLIVWLVRRNRFGGDGGGKVKIKKQSYKDMYY